MKLLARFALVALLAPMCLAQQTLTWQPSGVGSASSTILSGVASSYPQTGVVNTTQFYQFDGAKDAPCTLAAQKDCVKYVRFFTFDAAGKQVNTDAPFTGFKLLAGTIYEATTPVPVIPERYNAGVLIYAMSVVVAADGVTEVPSVPLATTFAKRPEQGVKFGIR